jgi:serine/threonine-protein kinase
MSPEQCRGAKVDGKADVYSLGVMLYQLIAGRLPYHAETPIGVATMHLSEPVPTLSDAVPQASPAVSQLVYRMMSKDKNARPSMEEILVLLQQIDPTLATLATALPRSLAPRSLLTEPERDPHTTRGISSGQAVASAPPNRRRNLGMLLGAAAVAVVGMGLWASLALHPAAGPAALPQDSAAPRQPPATPAPAAPPAAATAPGRHPAEESAEAAAPTSRSSRGGRGKSGKSRGAKKKPAEEATAEAAKAPVAKPVKTVIID